MPALDIALFVWQDQLCRAIMVVTTLHSLVNISELVFKSVFEKRPALPKYSSKSAHRVGNAALSIVTQCQTSLEELASSETPFINCLTRS